MYPGFTFAMASFSASTSVIYGITGPIKTPCFYTVLPKLGKRMQPLIHSGSAGFQFLPHVIIMRGERDSDFDI